MKRPTSYLNKVSDKSFFLVWLFFHICVLVFFLITFLLNPSNIKIDADLFNMFPRPFQEEGVRNADERLTEVVGQNVFILIADKDFDKAKDAAVQVFDKISGSDNFQTVSLYSDLSDLTEVTDYVYDYRWNLLDDESIELIESEGGAELYAQNALMTAYSPFTMLSLDNIDSDPFMLAESNFSGFFDAVQKSGTAMTAKDGVLASFKNDTWYVMIRGILSKKGAALASKDNGVSEIYSVCAPFEKEGVRFIYSGTPFNSHQSSNSASREITIISTVSLLVAIIILFCVFRTPVPILSSLLSIIISVIVAICTTLSVFHKMHILTLVFGTSLIGSCIDYSLHYFTQWGGNPELKSGKEIRNHLLPSLTMAIVSSVLCFAILLFAPFNMLKQMSLFSLSGLISSYLTTLGIYPLIPLPKKERKLKLLQYFKPSKNAYKKKIIGRVAVTALFVFSIGTMIICYKNVKIHNDLNKLYTMEGRLLEDKIEATEITQYSPTGWFIVRGKTENEALSNEKALCDKLNKQYSNNLGFISTTNFIPTIEHQKKSREACKKLLELAENQYEALGFDSSYADFLRQDFEESEGRFVSIENGNVPEFILSSISTAWLGKIGDYYYTVVMPNMIDDNDQMHQYADSNENVFFVNKMSDMGTDLDKLSLLVIKFFIFGYIFMFIVLRFFYNWKQSLKIISIPFLIMLMTAAVFAISKVDLEFFSITGLVLVFGLGLDYIIYMMENEKGHTVNTKTLEPFATFLSFITTVISFGALSLSTFQPVHLMGLSIFLGLTTAYISSMFYDRSL